MKKRLPDYHRRAISEGLKGRKLPEAVKQKISATLKARILPQSQLDHLQALNDRFRNDPVRNKKISDTMKAKIERGELNTNKFNRPTSYERVVIEIVDQNNLDFRYVGNGKVWFNRANPDFINRNETKIIEVFCDKLKLMQYGSLDTFYEERLMKFTPRKILFLGDNDIHGSREKLTEKLCDFNDCN